MISRKNPKYYTFSVALISASKKLNIDYSVSKTEIFKNKFIKDTLNLLTEETRNDFINWFIDLDGNQLREIESIALNKTINKDYYFINLANNLCDDSERKLQGAVFTPQWIVEIITNKTFKYWKDLREDSIPYRVGDLSCGSGAFLNFLKKIVSSDTKLYGNDINNEYAFLAKLFNASSSIDIKNVDTLIDLGPNKQISLFGKDSSLPIEKYDIIVGNPPYVRSQLLSKDYTKIINNLYENYITGNYDLTVPFLFNTINNLKELGIGSIICSSKFINSAYGKKICEYISKKVTLLEIIDFGDGQLFEGKTTYTIILIFQKKIPEKNHKLKVTTFPKGLVWKNEDNLSQGDTNYILQSQLYSHPWDLSFGIDNKIISKIEKSIKNPLINEVFLEISQGIRTGANKIFLIDKKNVHMIESDILVPFIDGTNIRNCYIKEPTKFLIWPFKFENNKIMYLEEKEFEEKYPKGWNYLNNYKEVLKNRKMNDNIPWYGYSRNQNLSLLERPKILIREMMPSAQFVIDFDKGYCFSSGYCLLSKKDLCETEYKIWSAILCTPTMEFQLRHYSTQLHSGWFRLMKQHFKNIRLIFIEDHEKKYITELVNKIYINPFDDNLWGVLDDFVADKFELTIEMRNYIKEKLKYIHQISNYNNNLERSEEIDMLLEQGKYFDTKDYLKDSVYKDLTLEERKNYLPIELTRYNAYHIEAPEIKQLVTFQKNKGRVPVHSWYNYTQGYSRDLIKYLLDQMSYKDGVIYDPFVGSGTTLVSCKEMGISAYGADISPLMSWITKMKIHNWDTSQIDLLIKMVEDAVIIPQLENNILFLKYLDKAFSKNILMQIIGWKQWINTLDFDQNNKDFILLALISILEEISLIRKHGSHYRFINKTESVGVNKLSITLIDEETEIKDILLRKLRRMREDINDTNRNDIKLDVYNINSRNEVPQNIKVDYVITSPPYLNRNNYFSQQKAELSITNLIVDEEQYKYLVKESYKSHVEAELKKSAVSNIPEVNKIIEKVNLSKNNNPKIPHMICGYFEDIESTLINLRKILKKGAKLSFVVGNSRWGGVVVPVDHLICLIAERNGYSVEKILVARYKGNSPQQMAKYGRIPVRESVVILKYN